MKQNINHNTLMKKGVTLFLMATILLTFPAFGGYEVSWYTINGGGGKSAGGGYTIFGTIGQSDAGESSGGGYEVFAGFWDGMPLDIVDFEHFARFADWWLATPCSAGNNWCGGADLNHWGGVDWTDAALFVDEWLYYCPLGWPLK